uniref:Calmodulin-binding domain-containing protein n=1 Tax=Setaria digitata TaxID=48799 RepID=A0A915PS03_9BILA
MRSQKRVRHIGKVRSLKNAAAGKWKIYRKHLEARKAWLAPLPEKKCKKMQFRQGINIPGSYILPPPPPKHRKIREPKQITPNIGDAFSIAMQICFCGLQRSPEELRERQRLREQKRLEKKLAKQRASTSTLPETRKEKKLKEASSNVLQKVSTEQKTAARTIKSKNLMTKETGKTKRLMNEPESKHRCLKEERAVLADEPKVKSTSPAKTEQKESMKSEKCGGAKQSLLMGSSGVGNVKIHMIPHREVIEKGIGELELQEIICFYLISAIKDQMEVCLSTKKTEGTRKEQKKKRNRRPDDDNFIPEHNAVKNSYMLDLDLSFRSCSSYMAPYRTYSVYVFHCNQEFTFETLETGVLQKKINNLGETHEMNSVEVNADFTEIVGRRHKKKGRPFNEQQSKFDEFAVKAPNENGKTAGIPAVSLKSEKDQVVVSAFGLDVDRKYRKELLHKDNMIDSQISEQQNQQLVELSEDKQEVGKGTTVLDKENLQRGKSETKNVVSHGESNVEVIDASVHVKESLSKEVGKSIAGSHDIRKETVADQMARNFGKRVALGSDAKDNIVEIHVVTKNEGEMSARKGANE